MHHHLPDHNHFFSPLHSSIRKSYSRYTVLVGIVGVGPRVVCAEGRARVDLWAHLNVWARVGWWAHVVLWARVGGWARVVLWARVGGLRVCGWALVGGCASEGLWVRLGGWALEYCWVLVSVRTRVSFVWLGSCGWVGSCLVGGWWEGGLVGFCGLAWGGARVWVWVSCVHVYEFVCVAGLV